MFSVRFILETSTWLYLTAFKQGLYSGNSKKLATELLSQVKFKIAQTASYSSSGLQFLVLLLQCFNILGVPPHISQVMLRRVTQLTYPHSRLTD